MSTSSKSDTDSSSESESDTDSTEVLVASIVTLIAMDHSEKYLGKRKRPPPRQSGYQWVMDQLQVNKDCYNMFRMNCHVFARLHETLVENYGLKCTRCMSSVEARECSCGCVAVLNHLSLLRIYSRDPLKQLVENLMKC